MQGPLKARIQDDMKDAMRARDSARLGVVRMIIAAITQREVDERKELGDEEVLAVLDRMARQHRESIDQFRQGGREDLADKETFGLGIIGSYLPPPLSESELTRLIDEAIAGSGAQSIRDMGKVMGVLKPQLQGRADMSAVSARVRERLAG